MPEDAEFSCGGECKNPKGPKCRHSRKFVDNPTLQCALRPIDEKTEKGYIISLSSCRFEDRAEYVMNNYKQIIEGEHHAVSFF